MSTPSKAASDAILNATLTEPGTGNWTMDLEVKTDDELSGVIPLLISGSAFLGSVVRGAVDGGKWSGRIEGGLGGVQKEIPSRSYTGATVAMILASIASDSGELISGEILPTVAATALPAWVRPAGKASRAIADLAMNLGLNWRIDRSGKIWIGDETYQPVIGLEYTQLSQGANDSVSIAPRDPLVSPGDLFLARQVSDVTTTLTPDSLEQKIVFRTDAKAGISAIITRLFDRMIGRRIDLSASYPARVILQRGDGTLDVLVDHPRFAGEGIKSVKIRLGIPGAKCTVNPGARVRIHFDEQDQSKPFAALWDTNANDVSLIEIGPSPEFVALAGLVESAIDAAISGHSHSAFGAPGAPVSPYVGASGTACSTLKVK